MANQLVTKVTNDTSKDIKLNEGNAGLWRFIYLIKSKKSYVIHIDPNATYREYWCATDKDDPNNKVTLSTDDCQENKAAVIEEVTDGSGVPFKIRFIPRSELPRETGFLSSLFKKIFSFLPTGEGPNKNAGQPPRSNAGGQKPNTNPGQGSRTPKNDIGDLV